MFFLIMLIPMIGLGLGVRTKNTENRQLASFPKLDMNFTKGFDSYWQDQFPFRGEMITGYNRLNQLLFKYSGNEKVIYGQDGMYYLAETIQDYQNSEPFSKQQLLKIENNFNLINKYLSREGINLHVMVVPNKNTIYPQYMPNHLKVLSDEDNLDNFYQLNFEFNNVNLKEPLLEKAKSELIYHKEDSHYNNLGAAYVHDILLENIKGEKGQLSNQPYTMVKDFPGDLTTLLYPSTIIYDENMDFGLTQNYLYLRPIASFDDVTIHTLNQEKSGSLYMIRDSFGRALIPMLSNEFENVTYSRISPYYIQEAIRNEVDDVVIEITERNMFHWLKGTPVVKFDPVSIDLKSKEKENLTISYTQEEKHQLVFTNVLLENQEIAHDITKAYLELEDGSIYETFLIYSTGEYENRSYPFGFSLYTEKQINLENAKLHYLIDNSWQTSNLQKDY